jgi:hypothetical protein
MARESVMNEAWGGEQTHYAYWQYHAWWYHPRGWQVVARECMSEMHGIPAISVQFYPRFNNWRGQR